METTIALQNPWKRGEQLPIQGIIPRKLMPKLLSWLDEEEILIIKGARQTGKTTLVYCLIDALLRQGIPPQHIFYFLMDNPTLQRTFSESPYALKEAIERFIGKPLERVPERIYLFLDEVQKLPQFSQVIKEYFDLFKNLKFVLSGSSVLQLSSTVAESLRGRTISFTVYPFSLSEVMAPIPSIPFPHLWKENELRGHYTRLLPYKPEIIQRLNDHLIFGGMPRIFLSETSEQKQARLDGYLETFIRKDVEILPIARYLDFEKLLKLLSFQIGQLVDITELGRNVQMSFETTKKYLQVAEEAFLIQFLSPFFSNKRKSLTKSRKVYFEDIGLRNRLSGNDSIRLLDRPNLGPEAENFAHIVLNQLIAFERLPLRKYFFRSYQGQEVDFVLEWNDTLLPVEVRYQSTFRKRDLKNLLMFMNDLDLDRGVLLTKDVFDIQEITAKRILWLPLWFWGMMA